LTCKIAFQPYTAVSEKEKSVKNGLKWVGVAGGGGGGGIKGTMAAVLRIHDILGWIRIRGSMPLIPDPDPAIFVIDLQDASKKKIFNTIFSAYYFLKLHLHHFSQIKCQKGSQNSRNKGFSYYFCMMTEGSGSGSIPLTSGSGSGRPKNMWIRWIRIRIRLSNTAWRCISKLRKTDTRYEGWGTMGRRGRKRERGYYFHPINSQELTYRQLRLGYHNLLHFPPPPSTSHTNRQNSGNVHN
jgi:hypothetical protein